MVWGLASAASIISTTGFVITDPDVFMVPFLVILPLALIGGGRFSTAGGLKFNRFLIMLDMSMRELAKLLYPHGVSAPIFDNERQDEHVRRSIWALFAVTTMFIIVIMLALSFLGASLEKSLILTVTSLGNFNSAYAMAQPLSPSHFTPIDDLAGAGKFLLILAMVIGRMETLLFLGLINMLLWRR
jgi:trk system potassium uptake protein TrkH